VLDEMQVTTILNSLPLSWEHVVTSLTHSGKVISMASLSMLLVLDEERMKRIRRIEGVATNLLLAHATKLNSHAPTIHEKLKKYKQKWKEKPEGNFKNKRTCYRCGKTGHFKANYP
jgi:hypothetical protein